MGKLATFDAFGVSIDYDHGAFVATFGEWEAVESDLDKFNRMKAEKACALAAALERETHRRHYLTECRAMFKRARGRANETNQARARAEYVAFLRDWW